MTTPIYQQVLNSFSAGGLKSVFRDVLGWDVKADEQVSFQLNGVEVKGNKTASMLAAIAVFDFDFTAVDNVSPQLQNDLSREVGLRYVEHLLVIRTKNSETWLWPKKTAGGTLTHEKIVVQSNHLPVFLAQRLAGLRYSASEIMQGVSVTNLREKLRGAFDTSNVTKKFYDRFRKNHSLLAGSISGLNAEDCGSYATLLLNRLMFIFFLQKKEFLNGDAFYLQTCLAKLQALNSGDRFYNFYKDLLLTLFFDGLNDAKQSYRSPAVARILGKVPYVNGGIFGETTLESSNDIQIPDQVFSDIFEFFESFTWHLDTRPTGKSDEINPEVLGYIFEQYINFTVGGKKENGAYYTKQDVSGYMVGQTLVPRILDLLIAEGLTPLSLIPLSGDRYIQDSLTHGWDSQAEDWIRVEGRLELLWQGDPIEWGDLDSAAPDSAVCLPGESFVEMFHRRERVEALRQKIAGGQISEVNNLVTLNLDSQLLLLDALHSLDDGNDIEILWNGISRISVIDPTCGSGAFLFAALEVLEDIYSALLDAAEMFTGTNEFARSLIEELNIHPSRRYFIRKKAALSNLYGTDLMPDAIETAKLRVFLALAACLDSSAEIEPLPDLDFNFKPGNLVVGIKDLDDIERISEGDLTSRLELAAIEPQIESYAQAYLNFVESSVQGNGTNTSDKATLVRLNKEITAACDLALARMLFIPEADVTDWISKKRPFHWFAEFPQIAARGGFDVVIGNPPYVQRRDTDTSDFRGYFTTNAPDLFAVCYERSLSLLADSGRHAFIVMLNLAFSSGFDRLRERISCRDGAEWWSTFGKRPDSLFTGVQVRNTILILAPGKGVFSTSQQIFTKASRGTMFKNIEYFPLNRVGDSAPFRSGIANQLVETISKAKQPPGKGLSTRSIYLRKTGSYWFPALPEIPSVLSAERELTAELDPGVPSIQLLPDESELTALGVLAGKIGYLWWSASGDDFHTKTSESLKPRLFALTVSGSENLTRLATEVIQAGYTATFASQNAGWYQSNIRWSALREITDKFDSALLRELGLEEHWRPLNIWYRQVMKSTRENANGVNLSENLARRVFRAAQL